jgi:hypothetical protein
MSDAVHRNVRQQLNPELRRLQLAAIPDAAPQDLHPSRPSGDAGVVEDYDGEVLADEQRFRSPASERGREGASVVVRSS